MAIKTIQLQNLVWRSFVPVLAIGCLMAVYFSVKWCLANTLATQNVSREIADYAISLSPSDPQTYFASAVIYEKTFLPDDLPKSLVEYEKAVSLSPNDFRLWFELGKARERSGDTPGAELALRKSLELAPSYSQVQWTFGNFLLRQDRSAEAFVEFRKAAQSDNNFANPAILTAWQIFKGDFAQIKQYVGDSVNLKAALVMLLAKEKRFDDALEMWSSLPEEDRKTIFKQVGKEIYQKLLEAKKYRSAVQLFAQIADSGEKVFALGTITNGGFEANVKPGNTNIFEWQIGEGNEPQIGFDETQKHGGNRSLGLIFNAPGGRGFRSVSQTTATEAGKKYDFEAFYKADLKTLGTLRWEIVDASDGKILAATEAIAAVADWTSLKTEFVAPTSAEAVTFRLVRASCATIICPISGKVWFDDFSLNAVGQ